jgi:hypothetical protein
MSDYKPDPLDYGVAALIGGVFIVLKLCGVLDWEWWLVLLLARLTVITVLLYILRRWRDR